MAKYINADALIAQLDENCETTYQGDSWYGKEPLLFKDEVIQYISQFPPADVRENVRGEWEIMEDADGCKYYRCSACHRFRFHNGAMLKKYRFCPICGANNRPKTTSADMRGEEHENVI